MKKIGLSFIIFCAIVSTTAFAKDRIRIASDYFKVGEKYDPEETLCSCVFNKNREDNIPSFPFHGAMWECSDWDLVGTCLAVEEIKGTNVNGTNPE
ncbi:MAG: hypothetical protein KAG61_06020 [Bacteriovoracaceae bacterium]|nr:hypothetical protein [Bacteriovoracaceae bacterium]